jgi:hypothetical protein
MQLKLYAVSPLSAMARRHDFRPIDAEAFRMATMSPFASGEVTAGGGRPAEDITDSEPEIRTPAVPAAGTRTSPNINPL